MKDLNGNGVSQRTSLVSISSLTLKARQLNLDTQKHFVAITHSDCSLCRSAGFRSEARINLHNGESSIIATLYVIRSPIITPGEIGLSDSAWEKLGVKENDKVVATLAEPLDSFAYVRAKLLKKTISDAAFKMILHDIVEGRYSDIQLSAFVAACVDLSLEETISLTKAMSETGQQLKWTKYPSLISTVSEVFPVIGRR